jgi:large subunit ribosomal protein L19e
MSVKLTKRVAADIMKRGETSIRIKPSAIDDAKKAITRDDVKELIKSGSIYAMAEKHNVSRYGKSLKKKRAEGRKRGPGKKKGTRKTRSTANHMKRMRSQRRILAALKSDKTINNEQYKEFYALVKGGTFQTKLTLLNHIRSRGVEINDERLEKLKHI